MGLITALIVGFIVFILVQYLAPGLSIWISIFIAGFVAGLLVEGLLKGLLSGLVIAAIGVLIAMYFFGGIPGLGEININNIIGNLPAMLSAAGVIISSIAGLIGGTVRRYRTKK
jgi:hypothetical protein